MSPGAHASTPRDGDDHAAAASGTTPEAPRRSRLRPGWGWGTPLILATCGGLFITSAISSDGTDLRPGRYQDLASLVGAEGAQAEEQTDRVNALDEEVAALSAGLGDDDVDEWNDRVDSLLDPAGLTPVTGEGLTITLSDAPRDVQEGSSANPNLFVVHQQDLQTVVNALWAGGAEAVTIQDQRIVTTTGIKCQGNAVLLQGIPYPQPYEIKAIGDPSALRSALDSDSAVDLYREQADDPRIQIGWDLEETDAIEAPAYRGLLDLQYAEPLG